MMRYFLIVLIAGLFACGQKERKKLDDTPSDSLGVKPGNPADTLDKKNDTSIIAQYIPVSLSAYISNELPEWNIPGPSKWEKYWWNQYKKDKHLVGYVTGDFNCDTKADHSLILTDKKGNVAAWAFLAKNDGFEKVKLNEYENISSGPIGIGIEILSKGEHGDLNGDIPKKVNVKCEGVTVVFFEKAARSYYWLNGKLKWIQTGD